MNYLKDLIEKYKQITVACNDYLDPNIPIVTLHMLNSQTKLEQYGFWDKMGKFIPLSAVIKVHPL